MRTIRASSSRSGTWPAYEKSRATRTPNRSIGGPSRPPPSARPATIRSTPIPWASWNFLIHQRRATEAAPVLRESLAIKEKTQPDDWTTSLVRSLLGEALAAQSRFEEAESVLLVGQQGLIACREAIPARNRDRILRESIDRLIRLYDSWGRPDRAEDWRMRMAEMLDHSFPADPFTP